MSIDRERFEELLVRAVDHELSAAQERELEAYLEAHPEACLERDDHLEIKAITDAAVARILADAQIEGPRPGDGGRAVLGLGFAALLVAALVGAGALALSAWAFFIAPVMPLWVKVLAASAGGGVLLLFFYVLVIRLRGYGKDPYREIDR